LYFADIDKMGKKYNRGGIAVRNSKHILLKQKMGINTNKYPKGMKLVNNPGPVRNNGTMNGRGRKRKRTTTAETRLFANMGAEPKLGREWGNPQATRRRRSREAAMAKLGFKIKTLDPNTTDFDTLRSPVKRFGGGNERKKAKINCDMERLPFTHIMNNLSTDSTISNATAKLKSSKSSAPKKPKSKFCQQFGSIDTKSTRAKARLKKGSRFKTDADKERFEEDMLKVDSIISMEYKNEAKEKIQQKKVALFKCLDPSCQLGGKLRTSRNPVCKNKQHPFKKSFGVLYFFRCASCGKRDSQPNSRFYKGNCPKCGKPQMKPTSIFNTKAAVKPKSELLLTSKRTELKGY